MSEPFSIASAGRALDGAISRIVNGLVTPAPAGVEERTAALAGYRVVREKTISIIHDLTQTQVDFKPASDAWSISQNVEHLLLTEDLYRSQIQDLISLAKRNAGTNIDLTFKDINTSVAYIPRDVMPMLSMPLSIFNLFVPQPVREMMFRLPLIPALAPSVSSPANSQPVAELRLRCNSSLAATEAVFKGDLPSNLGKMTITHPILGTSNIAQIFRIIGAHEERHHTQMRGVMNNPRFPR